jgi:hypothetical protein
MILLANRLGGFTPQLARSQVPPGNAVLWAAASGAEGRQQPTDLLLPGRSLVTRRSQVHEGLDPSVDSPTG